MSAATLRSVSVLLLVAAMAVAVAGPLAADEAFVPADRVGAIKRDAAGRIVPIKQAAPQEARSLPSPSIAPPEPMRGIHPGQILVLGIEPDRSEFAERARLRQMEIAKILHEQRNSKSRGAIVDSRGLTPRERMLLTELTREDREVRAHELAHYYTGRPWTAEPEYWFVTGPLGGRFAVAGHVRFDLAPVAGDAKATMEKLEILRRAARAPAMPSTYDIKVVSEIERAIENLRNQMSEAGKPEARGQKTP
jgi:hypothetical protein